MAAYLAAGVAVTNLDPAPPRRESDIDAWKRADITNSDELKAVLSEVQPTHVFHLGARTDLRGGGVGDYSANVAGVAAILAALEECTPSLARLVVASSRMVCRIGYNPTSDEDYCPTTAYGTSKVETERLVRAETSLPWVLVRPTSIWGPWFETPYRDFFMSVARNRYVHPAGRRIPKHFGFVGNTAWQLHKVMTAPEREVLNRTFYLADAPPIEVRDLADRISATLGQRRVRSIPLPLLRLAARAGDALDRTGRTSPLTSFRLDNLLTPMLYDLDNLNAVAGAPPFDLDTAVEQTVDWMRSQSLVR